MSGKKGPLRFLITGLLGAAAVAGSVVGLSRLMPKIKEKCCEKMGPECCGGHEVKKTSVKKTSEKKPAGKKPKK